MSVLTVITKEVGVEEFRDAHDYDVDAAGSLNVYWPNGTMMTFAPGTWVRASFNTDAK